MNDRTELLVLPVAFRLPRYLAPGSAVEREAVARLRHAAADETARPGGHPGAGTDATGRGSSP